MIASVRGKVLASAGTTAIVDVGGVGLQVAVTPTHALSLRVGSEASMPTALVVREDELALYGFADHDSRELFDLLRGVSGVGPKSAMAVLAAMLPAEISTAVSREDDAAFRKVSGIGPKTAKLIIISLAGKIHVAPSTERTPNAPTSIEDSVVTALVGLGWSERVAANAVDEALSNAAESERDSVQLLLRTALAFLSSGTSQAHR